MKDDHDQERVAALVLAAMMAAAGAAAASATFAAGDAHAADNTGNSQNGDPTKD